MPIRLPSDLPAFDVLKDEGVMVMSRKDADRQDIRPLRIALLNLMPMKIQTENQFARLIGATPLQIDLTLIRMTEHQTKNTAAAHMEAFYHPFQDWTLSNVHSTFGVCWGAMAMLKHFHGVGKHMLDAKAFGCFKQNNMDPASPFLSGFSDECLIPVSRWTEVRQAEIDAAAGGLRTL